MKSLLIITFTQVNSDPRVLRQISALIGHYRLTVVGRGPNPFHELDFISLDAEPWQKTKPFLQRVVRSTLLVTRKYQSYYQSLENVRASTKALGGRMFDIVLANDFETLPLASSIQRHFLCLDAHEFALDQHSSLVYRVMFKRYVTRWLVRNHVRNVDRMSTVSPEIALEYKKNLGIDLPTVIENRPDFAPIKPSKLENEKIRLIHHGGAMRSRKLEKMIESMRYLDDRFELTFMLMDSDPKYLNALKRLAHRVGRVEFIDPVPVARIPETLSRFDVGIYLHHTKTLNNQLALPNKLFEFVQARLAIAVGPSPSMAALVRRYGLGVVSETFTPMGFADSLNSLSHESIRAYKGAADREARHLSAIDYPELIQSFVDVHKEMSSTSGNWPKEKLDEG